jgi:hypothetical protein
MEIICPNCTIVMEPIDGQKFEAGERVRCSHCFEVFTVPETKPKEKP